MSIHNSLDSLFNSGEYPGGLFDASDDFVGNVRPDDFLRSEPGTKDFTVRPAPEDFLHEPDRRDPMDNAVFLPSFLYMDVVECLEKLLKGQKMVVTDSIFTRDFSGLANSPPRKHITAAVSDIQLAPLEPTDTGKRLHKLVQRAEIDTITAAQCQALAWYYEDKVEQLLELFPEGGSSR